MHASEVHGAGVITHLLHTACAIHISAASHNASRSCKLRVPALARRLAHGSQQNSSLSTQELDGQPQMLRSCFALSSCGGSRWQSVGTFSRNAQQAVEVPSLAHAGSCR